MTKIYVSRPDLDSKENQNLQKQQPLKVRRGTADLNLNLKTPSSSIKDGPIFSRPKLGTKVNSIDSLNKETYSTSSSSFNNNKGETTTMQNQGSPASTRRDFPNINVSASNTLIPSHIPASHGYAIAPAHTAQMLVDPTTGQHYILPAQMAQPQLAYYPVFYNPAQPPPPLYTQGAYLVTSLPNAAPIPQQRPILLHSNANFHTAPIQSAPVSTFSGYQTETPGLSTAAPSVYGDVPIQMPNYFQREQNTRNSMESAGSSSASLPQHKHSDDSMSPSPGMVPTTNASTSFAQLPLYNPEAQARFSTTSSSTSGFASGASESTNEAASASKRHPPRTPLYGAQPAWWGEDSARSDSDQDRTPTKTQQKLSPPMVDRSTPPEVAASESPKSEPPASTTPPKNVFKSIRMDIDLSRPLSPVEKAVKVSNVQRAPPTAFTVTFDSDNEPKKPKPVSLQDAARQKRFLRRNAPATAPSGNRNSAPAGDTQAMGSGDESNQDPKHYLFTKMIQGYRKSSPIEEHSHILKVSHEREIDTISEAGTYVIDDTTHVNQMTSSQVLDSDEESSSTATTVSDTETTPCSSTAMGTENPPPVSARSNVSSEKPLMEESAKPKRLMTELRKMREQQQQQQTTKLMPKPAQELRPSRRSVPVLPSTSITPTRICGRPATTATPSSNNNFRRSDGGRFSMRSPNASNFGRPPQPVNKQPVKPVAKSVAQKETPEMTAWLRRKEYDPRKSASEARKMQQLKSRSDNYTSNRSISFHHGGGGLMGRSLIMRDDRSNRSHDDLSRVGEEIDDFTEAPHLEKAVDELTEKCHKSIQLLKICNQNTLSESVENLLEKVVKPATEPTETNADAISVRLMRLNSAFDAIQKYFEEQSTGGSSSPLIKPRTASGSIPLTAHLSSAAQNVSGSGSRPNSTSGRPN
uniref:Uncharacterized protein n=1 Tax=Acrobeloides nanus TaxID=290746 RepID=A0A914CM52_9BILA